MNKKQAHIVAVSFDLLCLGGLWLAFIEFQDIIAQINDQTDVISFANRLGFLIVGIGFPIIHMIGISEHLFPGFINKHRRVISAGAIFMTVTLLVAGYASSSWIKSRVENAGYIYCRNASGASALAKSLVYTKNMEICEEMVTEQKGHCKVGSMP